MKIFYFDQYPNLLSHVSLSAATVEGQIGEYRLQFLPQRNAEVEWQIKFPTFLKPFYKYVWQNAVIPSQSVYWDYYLTQNNDFFNISAFSDEIMDGLQARVFRTYPSLVRDIHFVFCLHEDLSNAQVLYNTHLDVAQGIDVLIAHQQQFWAFNLYTPTRRAQESRTKKQFRHAPFTNVQYVEFPVTFDAKRQIGDFFLYGRPEIERIKTQIGY